jgi:hypothetical protein
VLSHKVAINLQPPIAPGARGSLKTANTSRHVTVQHLAACQADVTILA